MIFIKGKNLQQIFNSMFKITQIAKIIFLSMIFLLACSEGQKNKYVSELLETDRSFSEVSVEKGYDYAFIHYADTSAILFPMGLPPVKGGENLKRFLSKNPKGVFEWEPVGAAVSESGDFGYTWGRYLFSVPEDSTRTVNAYGHYITVWKKDEKGNWKWIADMGNKSPIIY